MGYSQKWNYQIEKDGVVVAKMRTCSEINWEAQDVDVPEAGNPLLHKEPGAIDVPDVTMERGIGVDEDFHELAKKTIDFIEGGGVVTDALKDDYDVVDLDRDGSEIRRVTMVNAYIKGYSFGDRDASARGEITIEKVVFRYDYPRKSTL